MNLLSPLLTLAFLLAQASAPDVLESRHAEADFELTADPEAPQWRDIPGVTATLDYLNEPIRGQPTEFRSRWTSDQLYFLFICPYDELNLKPDPDTVNETQKLWEWDVAEVFLSPDPERPGRYREFEVSPQGEWIDLELERGNRQARGVAWDSGFTVKSRIDRENRVWYAEISIPMPALGVSAPRAGQEMLLGLYRMAGVEPDRYNHAWQPPGRRTFHAPDAFGRLRLVE